MARKKHVVHHKKKKTTASQKQKQRQRVSVNVKVIGGGGGGGGGGAGGGGYYPSPAPQFIPVEQPVYRSPVPDKTPVTNTVSFAAPSSPVVPAKVPEAPPTNAAERKPAGRPKGSKNKPKVYAEPIVNEGFPTAARYESPLREYEAIYRKKIAAFLHPEPSVSGFASPPLHKAELPRAPSTIKHSRSSGASVSAQAPKKDAFTTPITEAARSKYDVSDSGAASALFRADVRQERVNNSMEHFREVKSRVMGADDSRDLKSAFDDNATASDSGSTFLRRSKRVQERKQKAVSAFV